MGLVCFSVATLQPTTSYKHLSSSAVFFHNSKPLRCYTYNRDESFHAVEF